MFPLSSGASLRGEGRHPLPKPAQWVAAKSNRLYRMRKLSERAAAFMAKDDL
jgi:hypothetical protein